MQRLRNNLPSINTRQIRDQGRDLMQQAGNELVILNRKANIYDWNLISAILGVYFWVLHRFAGRKRVRALASSYSVARIFLVAIACIVLFVQITINVPFLNTACESISNHYTPIFHRYLPFGADFELFIAHKALVGIIVLVAVVGLVTFDTLIGDCFKSWRGRGWQNVTLMFWFIAINVVVEGYTIKNLGNKKGEDVWAQSSAEDKRRANKVANLDTAIQKLERQKAPILESIKTLEADLSGRNGLRARVGWYKAGTAAYKDAVSVRDRTAAQINIEHDRIAGIDSKISAHSSQVDELNSITEQAAQKAEMIGKMEGFGLGALLFLCLVSVRLIKPSTANQRPAPAQVQPAAPQVQQVAHQRTEPEPNRVQTNEPNPNRTRTEQPRTATRRRVSARETIANNEGAHNLFLSVAQHGNTDHTQYVTLEEMHKDIAEKLNLNWNTVKRIYNEYYSGQR